MNYVLAWGMSMRGTLLHYYVQECKISGFCHSVVETFALLGCYTAYCGICLPFWETVSAHTIPYTI